MSDERRRFPRIPLLAEAWLSFEEERIHVRTRDLSMGGVCVDLAPGDSVPSQAECEVEITFPSRERVNITGVIAWARAKTAGVRFLKIEADAQAVLDSEVERVIDELKSLEDEKTPA
jgi:c-di-GMP-binding flagellar brake protein YcgR